MRIMSDVLRAMEWFRNQSNFSMFKDGSDIKILCNGETWIIGDYSSMEEGIIDCWDYFRASKIAKDRMNNERKSSE